MTGSILSPTQHYKHYKEMLPFLTSRGSQINQEFAFFPSSPPRDQGGIFELRTYTLNPGKLLEWETTWWAMQLFFCGVFLMCESCRRKGIEARSKLIVPVGAWFSQIGRLHQVQHMWQYPYVLAGIVSLVR